jgi:hypothetical protein
VRQSEETFRNVGDPDPGTAGLPAKCSLRGKRSDPSTRANALSKAVADPGRSGPEVNRNGKRLWTLSATRWRNRRSKWAQRPHSIIPLAARRGTALLRGR